MSDTKKADKLSALPIEELETQLSDLAKLKQKAEFHGARDFANRTELDSLCKREQELREQLRIAKQRLPSLIPRSVNQYHIFLASPGDVSVEREHVRQFFERYNRHTAHLWNVRFDVVDWENYSMIGVGRPQVLITEQTLEKYRQSLALVVGIMGQRFGSPTGKAESGTEEEFNWAMESHEKDGFPEIKWFFRKTDKLEMPTDPDEALKAVEQWKKVLAFRRRMQDLDNPVFYTEYAGPTGFRDAFEDDLNLWLVDSARPWVSERAGRTTITTTPLSPPSKYYENIERDFRRLDIAGIDVDRAFEIPLSEIYVRLRVMFDEDAPEETEDHESGPIDIQTALLRYPMLVIVGDPGSGKSTFLKYIALMLARSFLTNNPTIAMENLCLAGPLPVPIFLSCWDLADFLKQRQVARLNTLVEFVADRLAAYDFSVSTDDVETLLKSGNCCLLFDGLDEVPTDAGRAAVSRLLEECVDRYGDNRFVVTSRIRAYTGDTILKGEFTRCDIQAFDADDRAEFIRNWVALLFRISPGDVESEGSDASLEFNSLTRGIEGSDRIRPLAVNPLLLTVIAIVHWNRKRLPEQRVDLYDECVDVLLGQRKEAEHIQLSRKVAALDEQREQQTHEERAWVRKRFAEIALHILSQDGDRDEATKGDLIKLLTPRFVDQGAASEDHAAARAELFLDRQELRSGLLVSRRSQSYRFVHLTFQEYLAAWQLSNKDFDRVAELIRPRLRLAKWFETLQLLGAQWAKESDEKADRYVAWLLNNLGMTINDQAPVVALCANVVKDITGVAELEAPTRADFKEAVEATLDAFRDRSGVDAKTQVEILEALGQLGAAVKSHLIDATKAGLLQVRRRAIKMLLRHLSDDELFGMEHILRDRSKEPIKTYLLAVVDRDPQRAARWFDARTSFAEKASEAVWNTIHLLRAFLPDDTILRLSRVCTLDYHWAKIDAYVRLANSWPDETTRKLLEERSVEDEIQYSRSAALKALVETWPDETTRNLLAKRTLDASLTGVQRVQHWVALAHLHSEFGRIVFTGDFDGTGPYLDLAQPVSREHIEVAADLARVPPEEIEETVLSLSAHLGWDITKGTAG
ncbi:MAG: NACHT domain-containing protein [bacterium]|nr:NACHT domain-containing protein [bacterium]